MSNNDFDKSTLIVSLSIFSELILVLLLIRDLKPLGIASCFELFSINASINSLANSSGLSDVTLIVVLLI